LKPRLADKPVFYLLAGPNGAGKSTLYKAQVLAETIPAQAEFVNADMYEAAQLQHITDPVARSEQARLWADTRRAQLLRAGQTFVSETVFSHPSKLALIADAQSQGFFVMLLVVALYDTDESASDTHGAVALCKGNWTQELVAPLPEWAQQVLGLNPGA
jgi:predicted ABC-type ATPase